MWRSFHQLQLQRMNTFGRPQARSFHRGASRLSAHYKILGVHMKANKAEIKKNYYELAKKYHPDQNTDNKAVLKKFQEISEAYETLSDAKKRKEYDDTLRAKIKDKDPFVKEENYEDIVYASADEMFRHQGANVLEWDDDFEMKRQLYLENKWRKRGWKPDIIPEGHFRVGPFVFNHNHIASGFTYFFFGVGSYLFFMGMLWRENEDDYITKPPTARTLEAHRRFISLIGEKGVGPSEIQQLNEKWKKRWTVGWTTE